MLIRLKLLLLKVYVIMLQWNLGNKHIFVEDMVVHYSPHFPFQNGEESEGEPTTVSLVY